MVYFLLKSNRKSYALHQIVTLPVTLDEPNPPQFIHFSLPFISSQWVRLI